jgi:poly(A) polymerase
LLDPFLRGNHGDDVYRLLNSADAHNKASGKKPLDRAILTACLLYPILEREIETLYLKRDLTPNFGDILMTTSSLIRGIVISSFSHFPKKLSSDVGYIMSTQYRLTPVGSRKHQRGRVPHNHEFELSLKFLKLRTDVFPHLLESYDWWLQQYKQLERHGERGGRHHASPTYRRQHGERSGHAQGE